MSVSPSELKRAALSGALPNPEDREQVASRILSLAEYASRGKKRPSCGTPWHTLWRNHWRRYKGHHYDERNEPLNEITVNFLRPTAKSLSSALAAAPPRWALQPVEIGDSTCTRLMQMMFQTAVPDDDLMCEYNEIAKWEVCVGTGAACVDWDPALRSGRGDVTFKFFDPRFLFPDPNAQCREQMMYCLAAYPMAVMQARALWPDYADQIYAHPNWSGVGAEDVRSVADYAADGNWFVNYAKHGGQGRSEETGSGQCLVSVCIAGPELGGGKWRQIVVVNGELVVYDDEWDLQEIPWFFFRYEEDPDSLFADGVATDMKPLEEMLEGRLNQIADHQDGQGYGAIFLPFESMDPETLRRLDNSPLKIFPYDSNVGPPTVVQPRGMGDEHFQTIELLMRLIDETTGNSKALRGLAPEGQSSGREQEYRQEAASAPLMPSRRNDEREWRRAGRLVMKTMQKRYLTSRFVRVVGMDSEIRPEFWDDLGYDPQVMARKGPVFIYNYMGGNANPPAAPNIVPIVRDKFLADYDVQVASGSTSPMSRTSEYERAKEIFGAVQTAGPNVVPATLREVLKRSGLEAHEGLLAEIMGFFEEQKLEAARAQAMLHSNEPLLPEGAIPGNGSRPPVPNVAVGVG